MFIKDEPTKTNKSWEPVKTGSHVAICYGVIDLGKQKNNFAQPGDRNEYKRDLMLAFEFCNDKTDNNGEKVPKVLTKRMGLSVAQTKQGVKSTLRKILENWLGFTETKFNEGFDLSAELLGKPAIVTVTHKPRRDGNGIIEEITNVSAIVEGMPIPKMVNKPIDFSFPHVEPQAIALMAPEDKEAVLKRIEEITNSFKIRDRIKEGITYSAYKGEFPTSKGTVLTEVSEDQLPF